MKKSTLTALLLGLASFSLAACSTSGEHRGHKREGAHKHAQSHKGEKDGLPRGFDKLDLTDAQKTQIRQIMEAGRPAPMPEHRNTPENMQQERAAEQALMQNKTFDEAAARNLIAQREQKRAEMQSLKAQNELQRLKTRHAVFQVLTPEQQQKLLAEQQKRGGHSGKNKDRDNRPMTPPAAPAE